MSDSDPLRAYLRELRKSLSTGAATEATHYPALKNLVEALGDRVQAINEPKHIECGAPDFIITRRQTPIAYVEAKDVGASLDAAERSDQLRRYRDSLNNLILTDYLEFRWYVEGEHRETARLATVTRDGKVRRSKGGVEAVSDVLQKFFAREVPTIGHPRDLAQRMASLARMIRNLIEEAFKREAEEGTLHGQLRAFRETLIPDLTPTHFADMYAQTITYGLFAARVRVPTGTDFTREKAAWNLPNTNPFLRKLFHEIAGPDLDSRIAWLVDDLAHLLARADMAEVLKDFGKATKQEDPVVHFYETFLAAYDPKERVRRGVFYTPEPVVSYIVRSLDHLVKTRFARPLGLADEDVLILDPAAGTGTFLYFVIQQIHENVAGTIGKGAWSSYVSEKLLPTVFGFELLMAPYAVAHMKLGLLLQQTGYDFARDQRLGIYLTNALEEEIKKAAETQLVFAGFIEDEAEAATRVKTREPIMVVLGNPPYSVSSANRGEWITALIRDYKKGLDEKKIGLDDDYIKFIRFAQWRIQRTGYGAIGFISNNSHLSGLTHRRMRQSLLETFDEMYVLNLHGDVRMKETAPDGGPDENVFDIMQGVAIILLIKNATKAGKHATLFYHDVFGTREEKYEALLSREVQDTEWENLRPRAPFYFFVPKGLEGEAEYKVGWSITDIFPVHGSGLNTDRDKLCFDFDKHALASRMALLFSRQYDEAFRDRYRIYPSSSYHIESKIDQSEYSAEHIRLCIHRPFDVKYLYYQKGFTSRPVYEVMRHMLHANLGLISARQTKEDFAVFSTTYISAHKIVTAYDRSYLFPLYLYTTPQETTASLFGAEQVTREPNLSPEFVAAVADKLVLDFVPEGKGDLQNTFGPEDIFHYAYAVFHSPTYRERYAEFLKIDFPRLPLTSDLKLFRALSEKGEELVALHVMESPKLNDLITSFPVKGSDKVVKVYYAEPRDDVPGRVCINKTQHFEGVEPDVWEFQIGGYQVLHKWLKDRKGRVLSFDDLFHYQRIVVALKETMRLMEEIDELIPGWPIE